KVALAEAKGQASSRSEPDVEIAHERTAELGESTEAVVSLEQDGDADENVDRNEVLGLHANNEVETNLLVASNDGEGDHKGKDGGPGAQRYEFRTKAKDVGKTEG